MWCLEEELRISGGGSWLLCEMGMLAPVCDGDRATYVGEDGQGGVFNSCKEVGRRERFVHLIPRHKAAHAHTQTERHTQTHL